MRYTDVTEGIFLRRLNRFAARVTVDGREETVHVKNTGRLGELLLPGTRVFLQRAARPDRKTGYDLIAVFRDGQTVNVDSQAPNAAAAEWLAAGRLFPDLRDLRREVVHGDSRFDLSFVHGDGIRALMEVKGVTLLRDGAALFPDAPTARGARHLRGLARAVEEGYEAWILFVIQMKGADRLEPNRRTDPAFADALRDAAAAGVHVLAMDCRVEADSLMLDREVKAVTGAEEAGG